MRGRQLIATALLAMSSSVCLYAGDDVVLHVAGSQGSDIMMTTGSVLTFTPEGFKVVNQSATIGQASFNSITFGVKRDAIQKVTDTSTTPSGQPITVPVVLPTIPIYYPDPVVIGSVAKDISKAIITVNGSYTYTGKAIQPEFIVQYDGVVITNGTDYTASIGQNVNTGAATITINGIGNYTGAKVATFTIWPATLTVTADDATMVYGDNLPTLSCKITGFVASETTSSLYSQPVIKTEATEKSPVGNYAITASGGEARNYVFTYVPGTLTVTPKDLSDAILTLTEDSLAYTGNAITPVPVVTLGTTELSMDTDYSLSYSNNIEPGIATVTVTGTGNYEGQADTTFVIYLEQSTEVQINGELVKGTPDSIDSKCLTFEHPWGTVVVSNAFAPAFGKSTLTVTATDTTLISRITRNESTVDLPNKEVETAKTYQKDYYLPMTGKVVIDITFIIDSIAVGINDFNAGELTYCIYDTRGMMVDSGVASSRQDVLDRVKRHPQGLYIIKINNKTFKVYRK